MRFIPSCSRHHNSAAAQHEFRVTGDLIIQDSIFDWDGPTNEHVVTIAGGRLAMAGNLGDFGRHGGQLNVIGTPASEGVLEASGLRASVVDLYFFGS